MVGEAREDVMSYQQHDRRVRTRLLSNTAATGGRERKRARRVIRKQPGWRGSEAAVVE